jgi:hypothetical protein
MRPSPALAIAGLLLAWGLAGCNAGRLDSSGHKAPATAATAPADAGIVASHLELMNRLGTAPEAEQAGIFESVQRMYTESPTPTRRLRYACLLATPGHAGSDATVALSLLDELIAAPVALGPAELAFAQALRREVDARLVLQAALQAAQRDAQSAAGVADTERSAAANRRIQALTAENTRLKKELDEALAKLEAIAELERSLVNRPAPNGERP